MRIVIDLQSAQGLSRSRGIGRYSLSLARAMLKSSRGHEIFIVLNGMLPESVDVIRGELCDAIPQDRIRVWGAVAPVAAFDADNLWRRKRAELAREALIGDLKPDVVHITSMFEGFGDHTVLSCGNISANYPIFVTFYDLIPLLEREKYLENNVIYREFYENQLKYLKMADNYLSISEYSRRELIETLNVQPHNVTNISAGSDDCFKKINLTPDDEADLRRLFGLGPRFIMYSGAADERKNHLRLIEAFASLSKRTRAGLKLVIAGGDAGSHERRFVEHAQIHGLSVNDLVITGKVSDEQMNALYNLCDLFVFPSWHEGFGLPALEAMKCGAPVLAANNTSLPEVVGRDDALFNPFEVSSISAAMARALDDKDFRSELSAHGLKRANAFSWEESASRALLAIEGYVARGGATAPRATVQRPKMAFVSPLPPLRTGIADYSAELLPELSRHYDITLITDQKEFDRDWKGIDFSLETVAWFESHAKNFERILYQFGNSPFHEHMFNLVSEAPGVVVLHDFFLSGVIAYLDAHDIRPGLFPEALYSSHGYAALVDFHQSTAWDLAIQHYPCNADVVREARGVIVHSNTSREMATKWMGEDISAEWKVIPQLIDTKIDHTRLNSRKRLGIPLDAFVVCSFGMIYPTKHSEVILDAWLELAFKANKNLHLYFVGEKHGGDYGARMEQKIAAADRLANVKVTGFVDHETYLDYLASADVGVQLRTLSRGETSRAVLDCMKWGLATIVNAHGSMTELPDGAVLMLPDEVTKEVLASALESLWRDPKYRDRLGNAARQYVVRHHEPEACARQYSEALEDYYCRGIGLTGLLESLRDLEAPPMAPDELVKFATALAENQLPSRGRQIFVDISAQVRTELKTGVERVVAKILSVLLRHPPSGYRIEPVYADESHEGFRYARRFTSKFLDASFRGCEDTLVEFGPGDIFLGLDFQPYVLERQRDVLNKFRRNGVEVYFVVYDLLPIRMPDMFPDWSKDVHQKWMMSIQNADGLIAISKAVACDVTDWLTNHGSDRKRPLKIDWFPLGVSPLEAPGPSGEWLPRPRKKQPSQGEVGSARFIMVGTLEPRKGHLQALDAFESLWRQGKDVRLYVVGNEGWKGLPDHQRRTIPKIVDRLSKHPELNRRLFWHRDLADDALGALYAQSDCLVMASEGEGFGLPVIEAAHYGLGVIARDIPVFREVAGRGAVYFDGADAKALEDAISEWLRAPRNLDLQIPPTSWTESANRLMGLIQSEVWDTHWRSAGARAP